MNLAIKLLVLSIFSISILCANDTKVVYDLTSGDIHTIEHKLIRSVTAVARYYLPKENEAKIMVVISGDAYKFFIDDLEKSPYAEDDKLDETQMYFKPLLANLYEVYGVTFHMCSTGMESRKIKKSSLYDYVNADKMKSVYLIDAQNDGYAYMPIH